jgi:hypothetical protein
MVVKGRGQGVMLALNITAERNPHMSDCLHCDVNELVEKRLESDDADLVDLASRLTESLADLILLAPPGDQSKLMADVLMSLGQLYLEKSGAIDPDQSNQRH